MQDCALWINKNHSFNGGGHVCCHYFFLFQEIGKDARDGKREQAKRDDAVLCCGEYFSVLMCGSVCGGDVWLTRNSEMSTKTELRMPGVFPRAPLACKDVSEPFFQCLNENSIKSTTEDKDASMRGLIACQQQMKAYELCVKKYEESKPLPKLRVQEEYRYVGK
jgi:hypothetical protein